MKQTWLFVCFLFIGFSSSAQTKLVELEDITNLQLKANDSVYVINFWATWCKPCIKEIPYFKAVDEEYADKPLAIIFVSVNRPKEIAMVDDFWEKQGLPENSWLLNEKDPNVFIPAIADEWSGAIPATLVYYPAKDHRAFYEQEFTKSDLHNIIEPLIE